MVDSQTHGTLTGAPQQWFSQLPPGTIQNFDQLGSVFLSHFASSRRQKKASLTLFSIKQKELEQLRSYVKRLPTPCWKSQSRPRMSYAITEGLREGEFFRSLSIKQPRTFNASLQRAELYINPENAQRAKKSETSPPTEMRMDNRR